MKGKKPLQFLCALFAFVLKMIPGSAVLHFVKPGGQTYPVAFSCFSLTPYGYGNITPFFTAVLTCLLLLLLLLGLKFSGEVVKIGSQILSALAFLISFAPLLLGLRYYTLMGLGISLFLGAETALLWIKKEK